MKLTVINSLINAQISSFETHEFHEDSNLIYLTDGRGVDFSISLDGDRIKLDVGIWDDESEENNVETHEFTSPDKMIELINDTSRSNYD